tara:strand:+ start:12073 stop:12246 length:174 start_codon:yes stop_codon:yes gene_type:complete
VVATVVSNPPQWSSLSGTSTEPCSGELNDASGFEGVMTEFAMVKARDPDAPKQVNND